MSSAKIAICRIFIQKTLFQSTGMISMEIFKQLKINQHSEKTDPQFN